MPARASGQVFLHTVQCFPASFRVVNLLGCGDLLLGLPAHASWQPSPSEGTGVLWFSLITWSNFCSKLFRTFKPGVKPRLSHWRPVRHQSGYWLGLPSAFLLHPLLVLSLVFEHAWCQNSVLVASVIWNALLVSFPCLTPFSSLLECHCLSILPRPSLTSLHPCLPRPSLQWFFFMLSSYTNFISLS